MRLKVALWVGLCLTFVVSMASALESPEILPQQSEESAILADPTGTKPGLPAVPALPSVPNIPDAPSVSVGADVNLHDPTLEVCADVLCTGVGDDEPTMEQEGTQTQTRSAGTPLQQTQQWFSSVPEGVWWMVGVVAVTGAIGKVLAIGPGRATYGIGRIARWCIAAPLFSRIIPAQLMENSNRQKVLAYIQAHPGAPIQEVRSHLDVAWGTTVYHLDRLRKEGKIVGHKSGNHHRYWVSGTPEARVRHGWAALEQPTARQIAEAVAQSPGIHQAAICAHLDVQTPNASKHLARLEKSGLVEKQKISRFNVYQPTETLHQILEMQGIQVEGDLGQP